MKIGITVERPDLDARVESRFGLAPYLLIIDTETMSMEGIRNEGATSEGHSGIQMVILAISHKVDVIITGYLSPTAEKHLINSGIRVISGFEGIASTALKTFRDTRPFYRNGKDSSGEGSLKMELFSSLKKSIKQFASLLPVIGGVVLLIGFFKTFMTREIISFVFTGRAIPDTFFGTCLGSLLAGNPINSYLIGVELLDRGVTLYGVTAFITAWVSVGFLQLPAEISALG